MKIIENNALQPGEILLVGAQPNGLFKSYTAFIEAWAKNCVFIKNVIAGEGKGSGDLVNARFQL